MALKDSVGAVCLLLALLLGGGARADDWPAYRKDAQRSGLTQEKLDLPLDAAWEYSPAQPPQPAWPEPGVEMHRLDFDYASQPVAANGLVVFGSSADDTVRAVDLASGAPRWRFTAGGPVRLAPQLYEGRCYFAADDGWVYCLEAATGALVWQFRAALNDRLLLGNSRMVSRWPCRTGVLLVEGRAYVAAGMWPAEGVLLYALDASNGKVVWCNDTSGGMFMAYPHGGALAIGGVAPQGYLLAAGNKLLVPTGRSVPAAYDRATGRFLYLRTAANRADGGSWVTLAGDAFYGRTHGNKWTMTAPREPLGPRPGDGMKSYALAGGEAGEALPGRHFVVVAGDVLYAAGNGIVEALQAGAVKWRAKHPRVYSLVRAGNVLLVGGANTVTALRLADGSMAWTGTIEGEVRGLAVAGGRLLAATQTGAIICFAPKGAARKTPATRVAAEPPPSTPGSLPGIDLARFTGGYALVLGEATGAMARTIAQRTGLHVVSVHPSHAEARRARARWLDDTKLYGTRIAVQHLDQLGSLPYPDFFANLIVVAGSPAGLSGAELYRVLRPCGGTMAFPGLPAATANKLVRAANVPGAELHAAGGRPLVVRGKLVGALDWDSEATSDERLQWPLELLWFGGPGPARMINRHGAMLPTPANGRYFVVGRNAVIGVDAYNGCELWSREFPGLSWKLGLLAADDDTVYLNFGDHCLTLEAQTGAEKRRYEKAGSGNWDELPAHALAPRPLPISTAVGQRTHPLSGEQAPLAYKRAYGCGSAIFSATMHFFRSATFGMYDLQDDSGLRNFSGIRPACALSMAPALGLLIANEGSGGCVCSYNFQTSFAMAPAHQRRQEDWAVFYDTPPYGVTRQAALNLGAPGDRRDDNGLLWLGLPRPKTGLQLDCKLEVDPALGPHRLNADRTPLEGTPRPWLYGSAIHGIRRLELDLEPFGNTVSLATARPPQIDGELGDACWDEQFPLPVSDTKATVFLRHDAANLYLAYRLPATIDRRGVRTPWRQDTAGQDAPVWDDDSCEIAISDRRKERCAHLGMSASGARYDGLWSNADPYPVFDIPRLGQIEIDGAADDWGAAGLMIHGLTDAKGNMRPRNNFDPSLRLAWRPDGLLMLVQVRDNAVVEYPAQAAMWRKDSIELFMAASRSSRNRFHLAVGPGADGKQPIARVFFWDRRTEKAGPPLAADVAGNRTPSGYQVELFLPWRNLRISPTLGEEVALQVLVNDADKARGSARDWFRVAWHPLGHAGFKPQALHRLRLAAKPSPPARRVRGGKPDRAGLVKSVVDAAVPPLDIPRLEGVAIDGDLTDWGDRGFRQLSLAAQDGTMRQAESFDPSFRLGWDRRGLLLAAQARDQTIVVDADQTRLWRKDSLEVFLTAAVGSRESVQLTIAPAAGQAPSRPPHHWTDNRRKQKGRPKPTAELTGRRTETGYVLEALIPWQAIGVEPAQGATAAIQMFFNDADDAGPYPGDWFRVASYPQGHAGWNPLAYHRLRLAVAPTPPVSFIRGPRVNDDLVRAAKPWPWPLPEAKPGKTGEDSKWNAPWQGAVHADAAAFTCEMAIPWQALADAGIARNELIVDFSRRGRIVEPPAWSYVPVDLRQTAASPPRPYTVRLHFAELGESAVGQRVFDVKLQGATVLSGFDVRREAGGYRRALAKEFTGVVAAKRLVLEFIPRSAGAGWTTAPILNGLEISAER